VPQIKPVVICRCEDVTLDEIRVAIAAGARTLDDAKRIARVGMGVCQARTCGLIVRALLAAETGRAVEPARLRSIRPPVRPIPLRVLGAADPDAVLVLEE
jgi:bacterioferritin-associated ferredoxin